jgi:hypothetical protein
MLPNILKAIKVKKSTIVDFVQTGKYIQEEFCRRINEG